MICRVLRGAAVAASLAAAKNGIFEPVVTKNDHFAKTGSGQTQGKLQKDGSVFRTAASWHSHRPNSSNPLPANTNNNKNAPLSLLSPAFPDVCPEPVLVNRSICHKVLPKRRFSHLHWVVLFFCRGGGGTPSPCRRRLLCTRATHADGHARTKGATNGADCSHAATVGLSSSY